MKRGMKRRDKGIKQNRHDAYKHREKLPEGTKCTVCGVAYTKGRWVWQYDGEISKETICPACRRIRDRYPAGFIRMRGEFFQDNREEILNLVRNLEKQQKQAHPMQRIMRIEERPSGATRIETTGVHLARRIGDAVARAYQGEYSFQYAENLNRIRIEWER